MLHLHHEYKKIVNRGYGAQRCEKQNVTFNADFKKKEESSQTNNNNMN